MKKLLIATAAMAVVAGAQAQSSVSVYGIADIGYQVLDNGATPSQTAGAVVASSVASSRLGFTGKEDLGGGLSAEFRLEGSLDLTNGKLGTTTAADGAGAGSQNSFNRGAWVGLNSNLGSLRLGRQDISDISNTDALVSNTGNLGIATSGWHLGGDKDKGIVYVSPTISGVEIQIGRSDQNTAAATGTTEATSDSTDAASLKYTAGSLTVVAAVAEQKKALASDNLKEVAFGVKYNFGSAAVSLYRAAKNEKDKSAVDQSYNIASVAIPLANAYTFGVTYTDYNDKVDSTNNTETYKLSVTKAFSKRTTGYAGLIQTNRNNSTQDHVRGAIVGAVHTF